MSNFKLLKLNTDGRIEIFNLSTVSVSGDGLMTSLDKERLDYLIENSSEKIKVGSTDNELLDIINTIKFDLQKGFILDLNEFNQAKISLDNFVKFLSDGINTISINDTRTLSISASPDTGLKVNIDELSGSFFINNNEDRKEFKYESTNLSVLHVIEHNLNSFYLDVSVLVEDAVHSGQWTNDLCRIQYVSPNMIEIWLTESSNVISLIERKA